MSQTTTPPAASIRHPRRRWILRILLGALAAWLSVVALAAFYWPGWVERALSQELSRKLGVDIRIDKVSTDAFAGVLHLRGLHVSDQGQPLIGFQALDLRYSWLSLLSPTWLINDAHLVGPEIHVALSPEGRLNLMKLVPPPTAPKTTGPRWHVSHLSIDDGLLDVSDNRVTPARSFSLTHWSFALRDIGTDSAANGQAELHGDLNGGARLDWVGTIHLQPLESNGRLQLHQYNLLSLMRWVPADLPVRLTDGRFSMDLTYDARTTPDTQVSLRQSHVALDNLKVSAGNTPLARLDQLHVDGISLAWPAAHWGIDNIHIQGGDLQLNREPDGQFSVQKLLAAQPVPKRVATAAAQVRKQASQHAQAWSGSLKAADGDDLNVHFNDASTAPATQLGLGPLHFRAVPETRNGQNALALDLLTPLNAQGRLSVNGHVGMPSRPDGKPAQPFFDGQVHAADLDLTALAGYLREALPLHLASARLGVDGQAVWNSASQPLWSWQGDVRLAALRLTDLQNNRPAVSASGITATGLHIQGSPNQITLASLQLDQPSALVELRPDGRLNLTPSASKTPTPHSQAQPQADSAPAWPVRLNTLSLSNGSMTFSDLRQHPTLTQSLRNLNGQIGNIALPARQPATIALRGTLLPLGQLHLDGKVLPSAAMNLDLTLKGDNLDLTSLSPYAGRYVGYRIDKGQLDTQLHYQVTHRRLQAENQFLLKGFTWGQSVDSPDATGLPVRLATSLLRDVHGDINVALPLAGSLDDPHFHVWPLIWQSLTNLVVKTAAAPFKLLGALAGDHEDVSQIAFAAGSSSLDASASAQITKLASALKDHTGLQLEIRGMSDPAADKAALLKAGQKTVDTSSDQLHRLGSARANAIAASLAAAGVPVRQIFVLDAGEAPASGGRVPTALRLKAE